MRSQTNALLRESFWFIYKTSKREADFAKEIQRHGEVFAGTDHRDRYPASSYSVLLLIAGMGAEFLFAESTRRLVYTAEPKIRCGFRKTQFENSGRECSRVGLLPAIPPAILACNYFAIPDFPALAV